MAVRLVDVGPENWRACADLEVTEEQGAFVVPVARYLSLCAYDEGPWRPLAALEGDRVVGFAMWGIDPADDSLWIGGLVVDRAEQRRGRGRAIVELLVERARSQGRSSVALSYQPANTAAAALYAGIGFVETGETEGDEVVARLPLR
jgi:diamine N-acetyltransferase